GFAIDKREIVDFSGLVSQEAQLRLRIRTGNLLKFFRMNRYSRTHAAAPGSTAREITVSGASTSCSSPQSDLYKRKYFSVITSTENFSSAYLRIRAGVKDRFRTRSTM